MRSGAALRGSMSSKVAGYKAVDVIENDKVTEIFAALSHNDPNKRPKYQRLVEALTEGIRNGIWRPGDKLPAEEEITELTPYSLGTVQRALRELAEQGLVNRQHGLGSFVTDAPREIHNPWHCRFLDDDQETILPIFSQAISRVTVKNRGAWSRYLGSDADVMRLDRVILLNGNEFKVFSRFYADKQVLRPLWDLELEKLNGLNFKKVIVEEFKLPITEIMHTVQISDFDEESCERVGVAFPYSGIYMQAIARAGRDRCAYYQEFFVGPTSRPMQFLEASGVF